MADLKNLKRKKEPTKKKENSKMTGVDLGKGSEIMSPLVNSLPEVVTKDLNFKVNSKFHGQFKRFATNHDMSMKDLLERAFAYYASNHTLS